MCYRDNVCAVVRRKRDGKLLVCHRKGYPGDEGWQFPQGGYTPSRGVIKELKRELREEIGTDNVEIVRIAPHSYFYDFPTHARSSRPEYKGQNQRWVLVDFKDDEKAINVSQKSAEFDDFEWVEAAEAIRRVVDFKKNVYRRALHDLGFVDKIGDKT